ncbi:unnamed protein product, partial [Didymodactylos carnosus]
TIRELSDNNDNEHNYYVAQALSKEPLYKEFHLINMNTFSKSTLSSTKKGQKLKRDIQLNTLLPITTTVLSTTTTNIFSSYTSRPQLVQYANTTASYDKSSFTISDETAKRWANLIAVEDEGFLPLDIMARQMSLDESAIVDGSGIVNCSCENGNQLFYMPVLSKKYLYDQDQKLPNQQMSP